MGSGASTKTEDATKAVKDASPGDLIKALSELDKTSRKKIAAAMAPPLKIHGMTMSANAMGPILFATGIGCGDMQMCNLMEGHHKTPEFLKMNGFHQIPTLECPDGFALGESNAILMYLARQYAPKLYPEDDAKLAARVDWCLEALSSSVYTAWVDRAYPILGFTAEPEDKAKANEKLKASLDMFCATFIGDGKFVCGETLTIADYKALPYLFVLIHPNLRKKAGVELSGRLQKYVGDVMTAFTSSRMLQNAGGHSLFEVLNTKDSLPDFEGDVMVCGEGTCGEIKKGAAKADEKGAKIWGVPVSANACGPIMLAKDAGVGDLAFCDIMKGEHTTPEFLAKNPFHQIPTFEASDGFSLGESSAMLRYVARHYKKELYPEDPKMRAKIDWATCAVGGGVYTKLAVGVFYPVCGFAPPAADQKATNEAATGILEEFAATLLGEGKFVCGDKLSIAEYKIVPYLFSAAQPAVKQKTGFELPARIAKYLEDIMAAVGSAPVLTEGDFCIKAFLASKAA